MSRGSSLKRIAILGAESTGKSTLAPALAARYGTLWVPEYLREFVETQNRVPFEDDQLGIARTQRAREAAMAASPDARRFLFCDTTPLLTAVYSRIYWGRVPPALLALEAQHDYAATLVAGLDLPWVPDGLQRESEEVRKQVHECLLAVLRERGIPFTLLEGGLPQRLRQVEELLASS
ncbi:Trifunctional NAD biosynthesis/regulator protein NadR [Massilia sp. Bi118]|uniref:AAA family ATPase n=1 Tax=Massilia sp. Bi118 TaxID=2822346 RepID=UPI001D914266|nr:ATP-binding protein [Massilia sp. Bi118]CAH0316302.1 Trifunctional NAD biosynthesis/regulator protein NadR [Massilia sp. Bi118]